MSQNVSIVKGPLTVPDVKVIEPRTIKHNKRKLRRTSSVIAALLLFTAGIYFYIDNTYWYTSDEPQPLNLPVQIAGNFGEIRSDHWHMGVDLRTNGKENVPVLAVADGWVSRVSISETGYGNAIFISHAGNRTSVYAHLNSFYLPVQNLIRARQQTTEKWQQDLVLEPGAFPVRKGMQIAKSGNTGFSEGPHLHFEWRNTITGKSINPQLELLKVKDDVPPIIENIFWYGQRKNGTLRSRVIAYSLTADGHRRGERSSLVVGGRRIITTTMQTLIVTSPVISLGITGYDKTSSSPFNIGVYRMKLVFDKKLIYQSSADSIEAQHPTDVNATIDYAAYKQEGKLIQLLTTPQALKQVSSFMCGNGVISLQDQRDHEVSIEVSDLTGNSSQLTFNVRFKPGNIKEEPQHSTFVYGKGSIVKTSNSFADLPPFSFFSSLKFRLSASSVASGRVISPNIIMNTENAPVRDSFLLGIRSQRKLSILEKRHTLMEVSSGSQRIVYRGTWQGDWYRSRIVNTGQASLIVDTVSPEVKPIGWRNGQKLPGGAVIKFTINDGSTPVTVLRTELNGRWIPVQQKGNIYYFKPADELNSGQGRERTTQVSRQHRFMIKVSDLAGNVTRNIFRFEY